MPPKDKVMNSEAIKEEVCQVCSGVNPVWFAPNELWNKVMRYPDGREASEKYHFVCPNCFIKIAEGVGVKPTAWMLTTEKEAEASNQFSGSQKTAILYTNNELSALTTEG